MRGLSESSLGVEGRSKTGDAVVGVTDSGSGVSGTSSAGPGIVGQSESAPGVRGVSKSGRGVEGWSESAYGVSGDSMKSAGVRGTSVEGRGVEGWSTRSEGVFGICETGTGVWGVAGRSPIHRSAVDLSAVFRVGSVAKQWAESATAVIADAPGVGVAGHRAELAVDQNLVNVQPEHAASDIASDVRIDPRDVDIVGIVAEPFDDTAGIGVCGEHRGAGIGVKAVSRGGVGVAAYSTDYEAIHAETHSLNVATIAAYNLNPRAQGAAIYAKKEGSRGHAGFFEGRVWVRDELAVGGDITLANADCAEDFDIANVTDAEPGTVVVLGERGALHPGAVAYDKRVVGVISGAGAYKPGLVLDKQPSSENRLPVALLGKVYCKATADYGPIEIGDMLTTSPLVGYAMKASDPDRAFGAVFGKALRAMASGQGLIPVLVALQ